MAATHVEMPRAVEAGSFRICELREQPQAMRKEPRRFFSGGPSDEANDRPGEDRIPGGFAKRLQTLELEDRYHSILTSLGRIL